MSLNENDKWVEVFFTYDQMESEIVRGLLESGGIPVRTVSFRVEPYPVNISKMGEIKLMVRERDTANAKKAIEEFRNTGGE